MNQPVTRLYPAPNKEYPLQGLFLAHQLHTRGKPGKPFVYSNFITSLDGRIAIAEAGRESRMVPDATANPRDWRLYQELAGQADLLVTSGRFIRQSHDGEAQDQLPVGMQAAFDDIREWRRDQGLKPQPDIAIMSGSLDLPLETLQPYRDRRLMVITGSQADRGKIEQLESNGIEVLAAGSDTSVDGRLMIDRLSALDYTSVYAIAGAGVFYTLLAARVIDRLYLTTAHQLLGGKDFDTLTRGPLLAPAQGMRMQELFFDPHAQAGTGQLFGVYEPVG